MPSINYNSLVASLPHLIRRASDDDNSSYPWNYTSTNGRVCEMPRPLMNTETATLAGGLDFFTINQIVTGSCALFTFLSLLVLMARHATHLSRPNEQLTIMRICCYLPIFAVGCLLEVSFPNAYVYIDPWLDFAQAVALCNFFLMMCQFVSPSDERREMFFAALEVPQDKKKDEGRRLVLQAAARHHGRAILGGGQAATRESESEVEPEPVNGLVWYRRMWLSIFQYPVVQAAVAILTAVTESRGVYCLVSSSTGFAHLWLEIVHDISLTVAIVACLRLLSGLKGRLQHHRPLLKLAAFKLLVGITGLIQLVYWILRSINHSPLQPTAYLSWQDDFIGIPVMILAILTVPFSILFHFAYDVRTYQLENGDRSIPLAHIDPETGSATAAHGVTTPYGAYKGVGSTGSSYQGGFLGTSAWLAMLDPSELISGFVFGFTMLSSKNREMGINTIRRAQTGEFDENQRR